MSEALIHASAVVLGRLGGENVRVGALACIGAGALVEDGVEIGDGALVGPDVHVGARARIMPGAVVTGDVPRNAVVSGHPAVIVGYVDAPASSVASLAAVAGPPGPQASRVRGVQLHTLREVADMRGFLCAAEVGGALTFTPRRCFWVYNVPNQQVRGEHAHRRCAQLLTAITGQLRVVVDDGVQREEFWLDRPNLSLYLPPLTWGIQYGYSSDAVLMVLASDPYDPEDYIRDYGEFQRLVHAEEHT